jgi:hypothetical protein
MDSVSAFSKIMLNRAKLIELVSFLLGPKKGTMSLQDVQKVCNQRELELVCFFLFIERNFIKVGCRGTRILGHSVDWAQLSRLFAWRRRHSPVQLQRSATYHCIRSLHNLPNVLVQIANKMRLQKNILVNIRKKKSWGTMPQPGRSQVRFPVTVSGGRLSL